MLDGGDDYEHEDDEFNGVQNWRNNWIGLKIVYHFLGNYFLLVSFITNLVRTVKSSIALFGWVRGILSLINITYNSVIMYFDTNLIGNLCENWYWDGELVFMKF